MTTTNERARVERWVVEKADTNETWCCCKSKQRAENELVNANSGVGSGTYTLVHLRECDPASDAAVARLCEAARGAERSLSSTTGRNINDAVCGAAKLLHAALSDPALPGAAKGEQAPPAMPPEDGTRWNTGNGFYEWRSGQMSWTDGSSGKRYGHDELHAAGERDWSRADQFYGPRIPPTPPQPSGESAEAPDPFGLAFRVVESIGVPSKVDPDGLFRAAFGRAIAARDSAQQARHAAEVADKDAEIDLWKQKAKSHADAADTLESRLAAAGGGIDRELLETARRVLPAIVVDGSGKSVDQDINAALVYARALHAALSAPAKGGE